MKLLENLQPKYKAAIKDVSDERNNGDGWWIYLNEPFTNPEMECRIIHEQSLTHCIKILKNIVNNNLTN